MDKNRSIALALVLVVGLGAFTYWVATRGGVGKGVSVGDIATDIQFTAIDGSIFRLSDQRGKVIVVDFITTSCSICVEELEVLRQLTGRTDVRVVSVNLDGANNEDLVAYAQYFEIEWTIGGSSTAGTDYKVTGVPTLMVVDRSGVIKYRGYYTSLNVLDQIISQQG